MELFYTLKYPCIKESIYVYVMIIIINNLVKHINVHVKSH